MTNRITTYGDDASGDYVTVSTLKLKRLYAIQEWAARKWGVIK